MSAGRASLSTSPAQRRRKQVGPGGKLSALQRRFASKLKGAQFRWLNEQLYTKPSAQSFGVFSKDPELFHVYHRGFREQVSSWRVNPLDLVIEDLRGASERLVVGDFGCGEARLAETLSHQHEVHSFDLVAQNKHVIACDIADVPLDDESLDVAVFCLALMGTNYLDFVREAHRTLRPGGRLIIAEVESRFVSAGADPSTRSRGIKAFNASLAALGLRSTSVDTSNNFFVLCEYQKTSSANGTTGSSSGSGLSFRLKPCRYKKR